MIWLMGWIGEAGCTWQHGIKLGKNTDIWEGRIAMHWDGEMVQDSHCHDIGRIEGIRIALGFASSHIESAALYNAMKHELELRGRTGLGWSTGKLHIGWLYCLFRRTRNLTPTTNCTLIPGSRAELNMNCLFNQLDAPHTRCKLEITQVSVELLTGSQGTRTEFLECTWHEQHCLLTIQTWSHVFFPAMLLAWSRSVRVSALLAFFLCYRSLITYHHSQDLVIWTAVSLPWYRLKFKLGVGPADRIWGCLPPLASLYNRHCNWQRPPQPHSHARTVKR